MKDISYEVSVLVNGRHSVKIESDDPTITSRALDWLTQTFHVPPAPRRADAPTTTAVPQPPLQMSAPQPATAAPICGIHHKPMKLMNGRRGEFWSCHEKMPDGGWCTFKPRERTAA
jgi:hypothetical protein